ncbi:hypothetical protein HBB16_01875 [Pseudonocardia sp. MCCB 268]|nr:hypothetical protein [Pseudonocardia cytotoxica]
MTLELGARTRRSSPPTPTSPTPPQRIAPARLVNSGQVCSCLDYVPRPGAGKGGLQSRPTGSRVLAHFLDLSSTTPTSWRSSTRPTTGG